MSIFKKKEKKIITLTCPECGGPLKAEEYSDTAVCQYCKSVCVISDLLPKKGPLDKIFGFVDKQQRRRDKKKLEKQKKIEEENQKRKDHIKKYWWAYLLGIAAFAIFIAIMAYFE